jgi:hypothetical protein
MWTTPSDRWMSKCASRWGSQKRSGESTEVESNMARPSAVGRLSNKGKALIETLYFDGVPVLQIPARLKQQTGEDVKIRSLYHYCARHLKNDWRVEAIRRYQRAVVELMRGYSEMSESKVELAAFLLAILGVQHQVFSAKLDQVNETLRELKESMSNPSKTGSAKAA